MSICTYDELRADKLHRGLLEQAHKVSDWHSCYNPEKGRVTLLKSIVLRQQGQIKGSNNSFLEAHALHKTLSKIPTSKTDLSLENFGNMFTCGGDDQVHRRSKGISQLLPNYLGVGTPGEYNRAKPTGPGVPELRSLRCWWQV